MTRPSNAVVIVTALASWFAFSAAPGVAEDQGFPTATVRIIVPNPAGGTADALPRILAEVLGHVWQQPVVVENIVGAAGNVGAGVFSHAAADGYTLLASPPTTLAINQSLYKSLPYDPTEFKPITIIGTSPNVLIVNPKLGVSTVAELIAKAKAEPGAIAMGSQGIGSTSHLTSALFQTMAGVRFNHVAYRGTAPAMNDLLGGHILFMFDNLSSSLPQHLSGALKIIAVCSPERSPLLADVPTMSEAGLAGFTSTAWFGLVAPPNTPADIVTQISRDVVSVLKTEEVRQKFRTQGAEVVANSPEEAAAYMKRERALWGDVVSKANLKME